MEKHFLVSGGWGYGNLGDDAILLETVRILINLNYKVTILSFDPQETSLVIEEEGLTVERILPCNHRRTYGFWPLLEVQSFSRFKVLRFVMTSKLLSRILWEFTNVVNGMFISLLTPAPLPSDYWRNDITDYLLAGGGYMNDWKSMRESKLSELRSARNLNTRVCGQTIESTSSLTWDNIVREYRHALKISFRDVRTVEKAKELGLDVQYIRDIALCKSPKAKKSGTKLLIIPGSVHNETMSSLKHFLKGYEGDQVTLSLTRKYGGDVRNIRYLMDDSNVKLRIEEVETYNSLIKLIQEHDILMSGNLHGMILGYIEGLHVIPLSTSRKHNDFIQGAGLWSPNNFKQITQDEFEESLIYKNLPSKIDHEYIRSKYLKFMSS